jgi:hypothetical protein
MSLKTTLPSLATSLRGPIIPLALTLASAAMALDEYMPVPVRVMQINAGIDRTSITGRYQDSWENDEIADPDNPTAIPVQGKFGVLENLEGSMAARYLINDSSGNTGLDRPVLALKYADPASGGGGFLAISLPVGFEDIMNSGNYATMTFGAMYGKVFPRFGLLANASYSFNTEDSEKNKIDNLRFFAKPDYPIPGQWLTTHKQRLSASVAALYEFHFNRMQSGESVEEGAHLFQLIPGLLYRMNRLVSLEMNAFLAVSGQNQAAGNTLRAQLYFSLEEDIYNAL